MVNDLLLTEIYQSMSSSLDFMHNIKYDLSALNNRFACNCDEILAISKFNVILHRMVFIISEYTRVIFKLVKRDIKSNVRNRGGVIDLDRKY